MVGFRRESDVKLAQEDNVDPTDEGDVSKPDFPLLNSSRNYIQSSRLKIPGEGRDSFTPRSSLSYHTTCWQDADDQNPELENNNADRPKDRPVSRAWAVLRTALWLGYFNQAGAPRPGRLMKASMVAASKHLVGNPKAGWLLGEADPKLLKVSNAAGIGMRMPDKYDIDNVETKALLEELAEEEELAKKKRGWRARLKRNFWWMFQIFLSLILAVTFLLIVYYIQGIETAQIVDTSLWKWAALLLSLSLGRLLISTIVLPLMFLLEKLFLTKNRVIYYMASLKNPVINLFWVIGVLIVWVVLFDKHDLAGAYNAVVTVLTIAVVTSFLLIVETVSVKVLATRFHLDSYFARMQESVLSQRILMKLSQSIDQPKRTLLPSLTAELHPESSLNGHTTATEAQAATMAPGETRAPADPATMASDHASLPTDSVTGLVPESSLRQPSFLLSKRGRLATSPIAPPAGSDDGVSPVGVATAHTSSDALERAISLELPRLASTTGMRLPSGERAASPVPITTMPLENLIRTASTAVAANNVGRDRSSGPSLAISLSQARDSASMPALSLNQGVTTPTAGQLAALDKAASFRSMASLGASTEGFTTPPTHALERGPSFSSFVSLDRCEADAPGTSLGPARQGSLTRGLTPRERSSFSDAARLMGANVPPVAGLASASTRSAVRFSNGGDVASAGTLPSARSVSMSSQGRPPVWAKGGSSKMDKVEAEKDKGKIEADKDKGKEKEKVKEKEKELDEDGEELAAATHHGLPPETLERLMRFVREQKITTEVSLIGADGRGGGAKRGAEHEVSNGRRARALGYVIYERVFGGRRYIREKDLCVALGDAEFAKRAFEVMSKAAVSEGRVYYREFVSWVYAVYQERRALALTMRDTNTVMDTLHRVLVAVTLIVGIVVGCVITRVDVLKLLVGSSALLLSWVFIFGNSMRLLFEALLFLFLVHPFDVGDRVEFDGRQYFVAAIGIWSCTMHATDGKLVTMPTAGLSSMNIINHRRSKDAWECVTFCLPWSTPLEAIGALQDKVEAFMAVNQTWFGPIFRMSLTNVEDNHKASYELWFSHRSNLHDQGPTTTHKMALFYFIKEAMADLGISFSKLPQPVTLTVPTTVPPDPDALRSILATLGAMRDRGGGKNKGFRHGGGVGSRGGDGDTGQGEEGDGLRQRPKGQATQEGTEHDRWW